jgi:glycosyltransferase involved in cell wall biosynthesis
MEDKKKIWIISEVFYPDETATGFYLTGIAKHIAQYQDVNIICGSDAYEKKTNLIAQEQELPDNIYVHRIKALKLDKNKIFARIIRFLYLTIAMAYQILKRIKKGDDVWLVTNPAFLVPIAAIFAKIKGFKLTILVHDVFPENLVPINLLKPQSIIYRTLKYIFKRAYASVNRIIVCGRDMGLLFEQKLGTNEKIVIIENWADIDTVYPNFEIQQSIYEDLGLTNKIVFQYAGNIGRCQGLEELLDIIALCSNPALHFVFIGEGALKSALIAKTESHKITNVSFMNSFHRSQQNLFLNACDVAIVSLYDAMLGLGVPSKSYNIMAAGKPILYLGNKNGEIGLVVEENKIGWQFESSQTHEILAFFNQFNKSFIGEKGVNARVSAEQRFAKHHILSKYEQLTKHH